MPGQFVGRGAPIPAQRAAVLAGDDRAEQARIAIVRGATLSDTAHYAAALEQHVRNYDGSWTEWGNAVGMPIERP